MKTKKGIELAVSTLILFVLGILILIGFITVLTMGWDNFKEIFTGISGSEISRMQNLCEVQCNLDNSYDFCCVEKIVEEVNYTCNSDLLRGDCSITCEGVCSNV
jgi:hypothetical protein